MRREERNKSTLITGFLVVLLIQALAEAGELNQRGTTQLEGVGKIVGRVRVEGTLERPPPLKVYKNRDFCGTKVPNESLLFSSDGGVQNAVIIIPRPRGEKAEGQFKPLVLDNKNCAFVPHVQVAPVGSELLLLNSDPILHDVHARIGAETLFNVGLPTWRQVKKRLTRTGVVTVECDVLHTWMSAYIVVTSSPHFAVTDANGEFSIEGVPVGTYKLWIWHETLGSQATTVTVRGEPTKRLELIYRSQS